MKNFNINITLKINDQFLKTNYVTFYQIFKYTSKVTMNIQSLLETSLIENTKTRILNLFKYSTPTSRKLNY